MRYSLPVAVRVLEVLEFLGRAGAAQYLVAMREAAEAGHDVAMLDRRLGLFFVGDGAQQGAGEVLISEIFAVAERHIEEQPRIGWERRGIETAECQARDGACLGVDREGLRRL